MNNIAALLAQRGVAVSRFEFSYMAARRNGGKRRPPPRAETLKAEYEKALAAMRSQMRRGAGLFIGGKSLGGRVASMIAAEAHGAGSIAGLVCLGYPFHPPGKADPLRTAHLAGLTCPTLIVQGERDPFGSRPEVEAMGLSAAFSIHWVPDGDHDLGPRAASGFTRKGNLAAAADAISEFMAQTTAR